MTNPVVDSDDLLQRAKAVSKVALAAQAELCSAIDAYTKGAGPKPTENQQADAMRFSTDAHSLWQEYARSVSQKTLAALSNSRRRPLDFRL